MTSERHADRAMGKGDPQVFQGGAGRPPRFKAGDRVRVKELPDRFYTRCQYYTRGVVGTVHRVTNESPAAEDEAWDNLGKVEWFYMVRFRNQDLWPEYPTTFPNDSVLTEVCERWLEPA